MSNDKENIRPAVERMIQEAKKLADEARNDPNWKDKTKEIFADVLDDTIDQEIKRLKELGFSDEEIEKLRSAGLIKGDWGEGLTPEMDEELKDIFRRYDKTLRNLKDR